MNAMKYTEHGFAHAGIASHVARHILSALDYDDRTCELAAIAGYMHDIGNNINRYDHAQSGGTMAFVLLNQLGMDPTVLRDRNMVREGMRMDAYYGEVTESCALDRCMAHCREIFDWEKRYPVRDMGNGKVRAAGVAMAMQGSCISNVDVGSATVKLSEDGTYNLLIGAADMGTGCDTILAQMVAECMDCSVDDVAVSQATDVTGYLANKNPGDTVTLTVARETKMLTLTIPLVANEGQ